MSVHALGRNDAGESPRAHETRQVNRRHTAGRDLVEDRIATNLMLGPFGGCCEAHGVCEWRSIVCGHPRPRHPDNIDRPGRILKAHADRRQGGEERGPAYRWRVNYCAQPHTSLALAWLAETLKLGALSHHGAALYM